MSQRHIRIHPILRLVSTALIALLALVLALPLAQAADSQVTTATVRNLPVGYGAHRPESFSQTAQAGEDIQRKLDPALRKRLLAARPGEQLPIVIEMRQQIDLDQSWIGVTGADRAEAIVAALQATAAQSQRDVRAFLGAEALAGRASQVRSFWIFNGLAAHVVAEDITTLATRDDIGLIREDRYRQWIDWTPTLDGRRSPDRGPAETCGLPCGAVKDLRRSGIQLTNQLTLSPVEWGIHAIRADAVWDTLNISGTGVVVANLDTGVDWQHPALRDAYRGYNKGVRNDLGNWFDATDGGGLYPIDLHGHGTHTMGTLVGSGGIGVAPGAKWIAARVLDAAGFGYDSWIHAGFQWVLAPNGDPALAPDVLNNSWGNTLSADTTFQNDLRALRNAGIFAVFSNGNNGPDSGSVGSPAALPEAFAVGAIDNEDDVASFSSRGPSPWGQVRPHVAAPGVDVRSSVPGGQYLNADGTSMAAPHVAGTIALLLSANPSLTITGTAFALTSTAVHLTTTIPNNDSGYGRIDAYAAVRAVASLGAISGTVTRSDTAAPIGGVQVSMRSPDGLAGATTTAANGRYALSLATSVYTVTASAFGYLTTTQTDVFVITDATTPLDFALTPLPSGQLRGSLTDAESGQPINGAIVVVNTPLTASANSAYSLTLPAGTYELRAIAAAHRVLTATVTITAGQTITRNFALPPAPTILLVDSGPWYYASQIGYYRAALDELGYTYAEHRVKDLSADVPTSNTLAPYDIVIWSAPQDSPGYIGAGNAISSYLSAGGALFLSGQDVGYWDGGLSLNWASYYPERLKALALQDDSGSRALTGASIFSGLSLIISGTGGADNQAYPDAIGSAEPDATAPAFYYDNGLLGAQTVGLCLPYRAVYLGFGYEAIGAAATRREVMSRTLAYFGLPRNTVGATLAAPDSVLVSPAGSRPTQTVRLRNIAESGITDTFSLTAQSPGWGVSLSNASIALAPCAARTVTVTISVPPGTPAHVTQAFTLSARSTLSPAVVVSDTFSVKSPAVALLVDDDRWYEVEAAYQTALISDGISFDRWNVPKSWAGPEALTPSVERLKWYPFVIWFTGYDWFQPLTANNEMTLTQYLNAGGRLFLSSQSHLSWSGLDSFNRVYLGTLDGGDVTTTLARSVSGGPLDGLDTFPLTYPFPNYSEVAAPYPTATIALVGSHGRPIALARENGRGKAMFFSFPFEALPEASRPVMLERIAGYLSWLGSSTVSADKTVVAPGSKVTLTIAVRNDGPAALSSVAFTATLPDGIALHSGNATWSGALAIGQALTTALGVELNGGLPSGSFVTIPVAFRDADHAITFRKDVRLGIERPDLSTRSIAVAANPAYSSGVVTWTLVARNTGLADAPSAAITGLLPLNLQPISGTVKASAGATTVFSSTVAWLGAIPAGGLVTLTYQMRVTPTLVDQLYFGGALFDDGAQLSQASTWLKTQPQRFYFPQIYKSR